MGRHVVEWACALEAFSGGAEIREYSKPDLAWRCADFVEVGMIQSQRSIVTAINNNFNKCGQRSCFSSKGNRLSMVSSRCR